MSAGNIFSVISFAVGRWKRLCYPFNVILFLFECCLTPVKQAQQRKMFFRVLSSFVWLSHYLHMGFYYFFFWDWNYDDISNHYPRVAFPQKDSLAIGSLDSKIDPQLSELSRFKVRPATDSDVILEPRLKVIYKALDNRLHF